MNNALSSRLEAAVVELAGTGTLKDRLYCAYCNHLDTIEIQELPEEVQDDFAVMSKAMHRARALPGDSVVRASVRKLSNDEAQRFAVSVVRMYSARLHSLSSTLRAPARLVGPPRHPTAPRHAAAPRNATPLAALLSVSR